MVVRADIFGTVAGIALRKTKSKRKIQVDRGSVAGRDLRALAMLRKHAAPLRTRT